MEGFGISDDGSDNKRLSRKKTRPRVVQSSGEKPALDETSGTEVQTPRSRFGPANCYSLQFFLI